MGHFAFSPPPPPPLDFKSWQKPSSNRVKAPAHIKRTEISAFIDKLVFNAHIFDHCSLYFHSGKKYEGRQKLSGVSIHVVLSDTFCNFVNDLMHLV